MQTSDQESHTASIGLMTQFNETGKSVQEASSKLAVQQKDCDVSSVRGIVSTLKQNLSCDADMISGSHTPKPEFRRIFAATPLIVNLGSSSLRLAETQRHTDTSFKPSLSKNALMKSQKPNNTTTFGSQNKFQLESTDPSVPMRRSLPDMLDLGSPPSKPDRPPVVNIDRFGRNRASGEIRHDGQGMKIPLPPLHSCPSSNQAAALCQQLVDEEIYDDCITNPPPVPPKGQSSNRTETDLRKKMNYELEKIWTKQAEESKTHQESNSGKEDTNKAAEKKRAEPKGTTGSEEMKGKDIKAKKREKKKQKVKEKKEREAKKKFQIKKPVHETEMGKGRGKGTIHNADDYVRNERVDTSHNDLKQYDGAQSKEESEDYDDIGALVDSGLEAHNFEQDDIYDDIGDLETSCDIYDDIGEDCV